MKESPIDWLLEWSNPSVRYFTLRNILDKGEDDPQVIAARKAIPNSLTVAKIMAKQNPHGCWEDSTSPYLPKYKSSYWQIMTLSQVGMDKTTRELEKLANTFFNFNTRKAAFHVTA